MDMFGDFKGLLNTFCRVLSVYSERPDSPEELAFMVFDPIDGPLALFVPRRAERTHENHGRFADLFQGESRQMIGNVVAPRLRGHNRCSIQQRFCILDACSPNPLSLCLRPYGSILRYPHRPPDRSEEHTSELQSRQY